MRVLRSTILAAGITILLGGGAHAGSVILTGPTSTDGTYSPSALAADAAANPGDIVNYGGLTGISLWGLLGGANASSSTSPIYGAITTSTPSGYNGKNAILRYYVVGTGSNGAQCVVSLGQIDPNFGGPATPAFVAYQNTDGSMLSTPALVVPGTPGTTVSNLTSLRLLSFPALPTGSGGESTSVTLSGNVNSPGAYTLTMLQNDFTPVQQTVSGDTYTGIPLYTFVNSNSSNIDGQIVVGQATDGYEVVYSLGELTNLNNILAYASTGTDFPGDGVARTILPADNAHGRFISNLLDVIVLNWTPTSTHDFNADGYSDIAWRDTSGDNAIWLMNGSSILSSAGLGTIATAWSIVGQRDFNGDGMADWLWRDSSGDLAIWFLNGTTVSSGVGLGTVNPVWSIVGTGDFNGDGKGDILWRDTSGDIAIWLMNGSTILSSAGLGNLSTTWSVVGTGDFTGNGMSDILWQDTSGDIAIWFMNGTTVTSGVGLGTVAPPWRIVGTGDFNGDGKSDILWRNTSTGAIAVWLMNGSTILSSAGLGSLATIWSVVETGDFNGAGRSGILWQDTSGDVAIWFMNGTTVSSGVGLGTIATSWSIQGAGAD